MKRGVFWLMEGNLLTFTFDGTKKEGVSKSGNTYNHKRLWTIVRPHGCNVPYNYYPRGRVEITANGKPLIYMNPHIDTSYLAQISKDFELLTEPFVRYDHSTHYKCYLDENWSAD